ncbi:MAG: ATP-dependent protease LonB [Desulfurispora sp.]|uniref:ATP-dependent protease LonB n=1 Tax=Desulfurispora sp. TaxID=3014275 RepID=UPI004049B086
MAIGNLLIFVQVILGVIIGMYIFHLLRSQPGGKQSPVRENSREAEKIRKLRQISLTEPLAEKTRPQMFSEIIGQEDGIRALQAALCGPNPQHVIIYGPPGVGKTAAARLVLEYARQNPLSPFKQEARFVEIDATTARFDERGIADPLIGSVHDPIYQGAGPLGLAGVPQPKPGAVTRAHGGILFIDEIGELHHIQLNKLLKVMEDRRVMLESAYYNPDDTNIPAYIHDIFQNGLPADFRLVGATTRQPEEIPLAIRSRCLEVFFRALTPDEIELIAANAARRVGMPLEAGARELISRYAVSGREAVNMIQLAAGTVLTEGRSSITRADVEWVISSGQYTPRLEKKVSSRPQVGVVNGLAVVGPGQGVLLEIEATAIPAASGAGRLVVTGVVEEEELSGRGRRSRRKSSARSAVENVLTVLDSLTSLRPYDYHLHVNFPGGIPVDGPSAGIAVATAVYSAIKKVPVDNLVAMTGELSIKGNILPVGGVVAKVAAARQAGVKKVIIPFLNYQELFQKWTDIQVVGVYTWQDVLSTLGWAENVPAVAINSNLPVCLT